MVALPRAITSEPLTPRQRYFDAFSSIAECGYTSATIFDPDAATYLREWAADQGHKVDEREYGLERIRHLVVKTDRFELAVQLRVGCANCGHLEGK